MKKHIIKGITFYSDTASGKWFVVDGDTRNHTTLLHIGTAGDIDLEGYRLSGFDLVQNYLRYLELPASTGDYEYRDGFAI